MVESQKLDFILNNMVTKDDIANMATKNDIANMATKDDIANMATKDDLAKLATKAELSEMESNVLSEIDTVQEKANHHFERLEKRMDLLESTVAAIKLDVSTLHLVNRAITDLQDRVEVLEKKIS